MKQKLWAPSFKESITDWAIQKYEFSYGVAYKLFVFLGSMEQTLGGQAYQALRWRVDLQEILCNTQTR